MSKRHNKHSQGLHPKCSKCGRKGKVTKEGLCAICYKEKFGIWSNEFMADTDKAGKH